MHLSRLSESSGLRVQSEQLSICGLLPARNNQLFLRHVQRRTWVYRKHSDRVRLFNAGRSAHKECEGFFGRHPTHPFDARANDLFAEWRELFLVHSMYCLKSSSGSSKSGAMRKVPFPLPNRALGFCIGCCGTEINCAIGLLSEVINTSSPSRASCINRCSCPSASWSDTCVISYFNRLPSVSVNLPYK